MPLRGMYLNHRRRLLLALVVVVLVASNPVEAQTTTTLEGELDYETVAPGIIVESIDFNEVTLHLALTGEPFTGSAQLELAHDVPSQECMFHSSHEWDFSGDFNPATGQLLGTYVELVETTTGNCPDNFTFHSNI